MNTQGDLPTLAESGVPGFDVISWYGIYAPAGLPREMVMKLNSAFNAALHSPGIRDRMTTGGWIPVGGTVERFAAHTRTKVERRARVVESANARVDSVSFRPRVRRI
jgi:tripartite-type tricarboxylate transporter receptor subunit TctC